MVCTPGRPEIYTLILYFAKTENSDELADVGHLIFKQTTPDTHTHTRTLDQNRIISMIRFGTESL